VEFDSGTPHGALSVVKFKYYRGEPRQMKIKIKAIPLVSALLAGSLFIALV
jgi:hypothetical protein